jgi:hypothetical protein
MALPEQIRKQTEAVQELYKQLNAADENTGAEETPANGTDTPVEAVDTQNAADETSAENNAAPSPASEHKSGDDNASEETLLQKYRTLQGMYNAEVPRLHQQNRELAQRVQQLEQLLATLSAQQSAPAAAQQPVVDKLITEKDVEEYGESLDVMRRVSREELAPLAQRIAQIETVLRQMQTNIVPQVQTIAQRQQMSAEQQFWADLAAAIPNFREINENEAFQAWLLEADPLTGITRQTYLEDAQRNLDARRVINIFRAWLEITGQATVAQSTGRAANSELAKQIAPGRSRGSGTPAVANKAKIYTPADIAKFFNDVRAGKYKGREQERDRIERDIFAAQRENRIQFTA